MLVFKCFALEVLNLEIRKASKEDIKGVSRVYVDSWRNTYRGLVPDDYLDNYRTKRQKKSGLIF